MPSLNYRINIRNYPDRKTTTISKTVLWWEAHRALYNVYMLIIGYCSFYIGYISFPFIYIFIGLTLNITYTLSWVLELLCIRPFHSDRLTKVYTQIFTILFYGYSTISVLLYAIYPNLLQWAVDVWLL